MRRNTIVLVLFLCAAAIGQTPLMLLRSEPVYAGSGFQLYGGQMAVATVNWDPPGEQFDSGTYNLIALIRGTGTVKIMAFDPNSSPLIYPVDSVDVNHGIPIQRVPWDPSFIWMQIEDDDHRHPCLVIPTISIAPSVSNDVVIYDLETRHQYENLYPTDDDIVDVFKIRESGDPYEDLYGISINGEEGASSIRITELEHQGTTPNFHDCFAPFVPDRIHYACISWEDVPARLAESIILQPQDGGTEFSQYIVTTCHNISANIWDATTFEPLSQIGVAQPGGSQPPLEGYGYPRVQVDHELGDTHRATAVRREDGVPALLFLPDHTMGMLVYDILDPEDPKFVWQWDSDTQLFDETIVPGETTPFAWTGSGEYEDTPDGYSRFHPPGNLFGMDSYSSPGSEEIHVFAGDGVDGLLAFDFSHFFCPFGSCRSDRMLDYFNIYYRYEHQVTEYVNRIAYDVRTFDLPEGVFVITSWKENIENAMGEYHISVHEDVVAQGRNRCIASSEPELSNEDVSRLPLARLSSANPTSESISVMLSSGGGDMTVNVFDICGRRVFEEDIPGETAVFEWNSCSETGDEVPPGRYFIMISDGAGQTVTLPVLVVAD
ncbi:MAG: hypothetical protein JXA64_12085 [Candidatus Fermentibacteraceae bacterium]|nr:hypothetical protein [Candidatus Fermentibacteraceae bacterium]MBN2609838.1 hypothetical protein [Candidatus Fermentibacteraceae bacterium]